MAMASGEEGGSDGVPATTDLIGRYRFRLRPFLLSQTLVRLVV